MKIVSFPECNTVYATHQPEYMPLPAHKAEDGTVTGCWRLSFKERIKVLLIGNIFIQIMTFNKPLQPHRIDIVNPVKGE